MTIKTKAGDFELASPFEAFPHYLELPPVKRDYIAGAARFKLRSLHPGDPLSTRVDVRTADASGKESSFNSSTPVRVVAHASPALDGSGEFSRTVIPGYAILAAGWREYIKSGGVTATIVTGFLIAERWIQAVRFERGIAIAGSARRLSSLDEIAKAAIDCAAALPTIAKDSEQSNLFVIRLPGAEQATIPSIAGYLDNVSIDAGRVLSRINTATERLFKAERPRVSKPLAFATALIAALVLVSAGIRLNKTARAWETQASMAKKEYESRRAATAELMTLVNERDALLAEATPNDSNTAPTAYSVFSRIAALLPDARLSSFSLQDGSVKFTARSADALTAVAKLRGDAFFADITLILAVPAPEGGETFSISGKVSP